METGSNSTPGPEREPLAGRILKMVLVAVLVIVFFLLGQGLVQHRFFRGQRLRQDGSLGQ